MEDILHGRSEIGIWFSLSTLQKALNLWHMSTTCRLPAGKHNTVWTGESLGLRGRPLQSQSQLVWLQHPEEVTAKQNKQSVINDVSTDYFVLITFWSPFKSDMMSAPQQLPLQATQSPPPPPPFFPSPPFFPLPPGWLVGDERELAAEKAAPKLGDILRSRWCGLHGLVVQRMIKPQVLVP